MGRRLVYSVAASLDGFIADAEGGYDWIVHDDAIDFEALFARYGTLLMGRGTYEVATSGPRYFRDRDWIVVSTTLHPSEHPEVTVVGEGVEEFVRGLKERRGEGVGGDGAAADADEGEDGDGDAGEGRTGDVWLFGGGVLFRSMLEAGLVDEVEVAVIPRLLGEGIPLLPGLRGIAELTLESQRAYPSGIVMLRYRLEGVEAGG